MTVGVELATKTDEEPGPDDGAELDEDTEDDEDDETEDDEADEEEGADEEDEEDDEDDEDVEGVVFSFPWTWRLSEVNTSTTSFFFIINPRLILGDWSG